MLAGGVKVEEFRLNTGWKSEIVQILNLDGGLNKIDYLYYF